MMRIGGLCIQLYNNTHGLTKVKDGLIISYALELGHRGQGGDPVQAILCPVETPARIKPEGQRYSYRTQ